MHLNQPLIFRGYAFFKKNLSLSLSLPQLFWRLKFKYEPRHKSASDLWIPKIYRSFDVSLNNPQKKQLLPTITPSSPKKLQISRGAKQLVTAHLNNPNFAPWPTSWWHFWVKHCHPCHAWARPPHHRQRILHLSRSFGAPPQKRPSLT